MKLFVPKLTIDEKEGFTPEKDIFGREPYGKRLLSLIKNTDDEVVLALDAPWGAGKSTFIKMWQGLLHQNEFPNIYFDAFENDYQESAFLALTSQIYSLIDDTDEGKKEAFKEKTVSAVKTVARAALRIGVKSATAGLIDVNELADTVNQKDASKETSDLVDKLVGEKLDKAKKDNECLTHFKKSLSKLCGEMSESGKVIFIIDELDRCRPDFALALLESIKHLFSVPQLTFVLVMNRIQLEEAVKCKYGSGVDANRYLQKFVSLWTTLPNETDRTGSVRSRYLNSCLEEMGFNSATNQAGMELFDELVNYFKMSLREIEKSLSNFAIVFNLMKGKMYPHFYHAAIFLSISKSIFPSVYSKIIDNSISYEEIIKLTQLELLKEEWASEGLEEHILKWLLKFDLSDEETSRKLMTQGNPYSPSARLQRGIFKTVGLWLETFRT